MDDDERSGLSKFERRRAEFEKLHDGHGGIAMRQSAEMLAKNAEAGAEEAAAMEEEHCREKGSFGKLGGRRESKSLDKKLDAVQQNLGISAVHKSPPASQSAFTVMELGPGPIF